MVNLANSFASIIGGAFSIYRAVWNDIHYSVSFVASNALWILYYSVSVIVLIIVANSTSNEVHYNCQTLQSLSFKTCIKKF